MGRAFNFCDLRAGGEPRLADTRTGPAGEATKEPAFDLFAMGMQGFGWTVECSTDLRQWQPCDAEFPYGWVDGNSNRADAFLARFESGARFYRLRGNR